MRRSWVVHPDDEFFTNDRNERVPTIFGHQLDLVCSMSFYSSAQCFSEHIYCLSWK